MRLRILPAFLVVAWTSSVQAQNSSHAIVLGFDRFFATAKDDGNHGGRLLLGELNCTSCHKADAGMQPWIAKKQAPVLDGVGGRIRADYLQAFLGDPQVAKPGTAMPDLLAALPAQERQENLEALVHFLVSTGTFVDTRPVPKSIAKGKKLFHEIGCAACHGPYESKLKDEATVLPLGDLAKKYSIVALTLFLRDPHLNRPAGRMPSLNLSYGEAQDIAHYLLRGPQVPDGDGPRSADFRVDASKAQKGRAAFANLGCANCHDLKDGNTNLVSTLKAADLAKLTPRAGCLASPAESHRAPRYALNGPQRAALNEALRSAAPHQLPSAKDIIAQAFTSFNCYACHQRDGKGGVEFGLNDFFMTTQKEMGDEGRLPPHLSGVGGKLTAAYLNKVLAGGAADRPYMRTRMPKFGDGSISRLQAVLEAADPVPTAPLPTFKSAEKAIKSQGRQMVGNKGFGCIKCHTFREFKAGGVQGINMNVMTDRLRREWFTQYLLDPNKFRPGTRMPAAWPLGQSMLPKVLEGDTAQQIEAIWRYLADGATAALPYGVGKEPLPLIAQSGALIYRNFIAGAGTRAIGVGYPERINLAFDANDLRYALLWHQEFMDAARHWTNRGEGFEPPLGEGVLKLPSGPTVALIHAKDETWPAKVLKGTGYQFHGYRLDDKQRPTFQYSLGDVRIDDFMLPTEGKDGPRFRRLLTITADKEPESLWYRAAAGPQIKDSGDGWYAVGSDLKIRVEAPAPPMVRTLRGTMELLVPVRGKLTKIVQEYVW